VHRLVKTSLVAGLTGALTVSVAWAGVGLVPVPAPVEQAAQTAGGLLPSSPGTGEVAVDRTTQPAATSGPLQPGRWYAGASKVSLLPDPEGMAKRYPTRFAGARWERDPAKCKVLDPVFLQRLAQNTGGELDHLASTGSPWPENPNCLYMGGYGLGPMNPIAKFADIGLYVRALALSDGVDTTVLTVIDAEGWLWDYANKCDDCGIKQIAEQLAADPALKERGVTVDSFNLHATHSHTAMDFLGGWGFVPDWYMAQATDAIKQAVTEAVAALEPAAIEVGKADARPHNSERRETYRSAEESELTWLRAVALPAPGASANAARRTIATMGAFAAHPVTQDVEEGVAHPDWPGFFADAVEKRFGGVGMHFMTGLGNVTGARSRHVHADGQVDNNSTGDALAALIAEPGKGRQVGRADLRQATATWKQPVTNVPLDALGTPGFFDRQFDVSPAEVRVGKSAEAPCVSAAPQSVELPARAVKLGDDVVITTAPGEVFSNLTNTIKEKSPGAVVFPLGQTNDSLGYMPQSFELNPVGQQGLGFAIGGFVFVNYEDSYAVDRCVGDMVLETTLRLVRDLT
jgi:hypothetical protein